MTESKRKSKLKQRKLAAAAKPIRSEAITTKSTIAQRATVLSSPGLPERIEALNLGKKEALALKQGLIHLERVNLDTIAISPNVHKANVQGNELYSLRTKSNLRLVFGVDKEAKKVLLYDVIKRQ